jgi:hypothetical protein
MLKKQGINHYGQVDRYGTVVQTTHERRIFGAEMTHMSLSLPMAGVAHSG